MERGYANYHAALKVLLQKGDEFLFLRQLPDSKLDLPGGRIDNVEYEIPLLDVLEREVREELGDKIEYTVGQPIMLYRRYYAARDYRIFIATYSGKYISGDIVLSEEHSGYEWINPKTYAFNQEDFYTKEEYDALADYFKNLKI
jgi:8-oxo-dGTP diphosphatase